MTTLEHPAQILTPHAWRERVASDMASGTLEDPRTLYLTAAGTTLGPALLVDAWDVNDEEHRGNASRIARALIHGDESHRNGCASGAFRTWERDSCGTCALLGWGAHDEEHGTPAPNYAGWARIYVQAREAIPRAWLPAFVASLNDEANTAYRDALRRDVATFGYRITDERAGYRLPIPTGARLLAWLKDYYGDDPNAIEEARRAILTDDDYNVASRRAARAARADRVERSI